MTQRGPVASRGRSPVRDRTRTDPPGLLARRIAAAAVDGVLRRGRPLDETLDQDPRVATLEPRDRAFVHALVRLTCRRLGQILVMLDQRLDRGLPARAGALEAILATAVAQLVYMDVPDHAAVDLAVHLVHDDRDAARYAGLSNAVLRTIARERESAADIGPEANLPEWLGERWARTYGPEVALRMAEAQTGEAPLDLTAKTDPARWAETLGGTLLPTGTIRLTEPKGPVPALPGFADGAWWVQDAAALLPVLVCGPVKGKRVLDLCAAPGGKTAALAARGAKVTAVDRQPERMARLAQNLDRLKLQAEPVVRDVLDLRFETPFDIVLLDAPCTATGTIRRHPDVAWIKRASDVGALATVQAKLLDHAAGFVAPGGRLVYGTCSLEPEEGEGQVEAFLARHADFVLDPVKPTEIGGWSDVVTPAGTLRSRPDMLVDNGGIDGFFVARFRRVAPTDALA